MKSIRLTRHATEKLRILREQGYSITEQQLEAISRSGQKVTETHSGRMVAQGPLDARHVLRVVYEEDDL